ncbi:hypothetical protein LSTR_LSTR004454 [Laodelphax striatellus]|uniref:C2H2-type domain-containing protein n=1 Tax=Laodelphax striatellus TaxID=195883 RepID=A0A482X993_LAOST|nr:hypothetical protein LSTR_LSTR004454 [Laodelphax striatellus]
MNHDQSDSGSYMQESGNEFEFVEVKMEPYEELDVEQMKSEPECDAASKMWNEVGSSYQTCIKDKLIKKEEEEQEEQQDELSVADGYEEQSGNSVDSSGLGHPLNRPGIEQSTSSPLFSCTRCDYKCARFSILSKHIRTTHVVAKSNECDGANQSGTMKQNSADLNSRLSEQTKLGRTQKRFLGEGS